MEKKLAETSLRLDISEDLLIGLKKKIKNCDNHEEIVSLKSETNEFATVRQSKRNSWSPLRSSAPHAGVSMSETNRLLAVYLPDNILLPKSFAHLLSLRDAFNDWCRDSCSSGNSTPLEQFVDNVDGDDDNDELLLSNNIDQACKTLMNHDAIAKLHRTQELLRTVLKQDVLPCLNIPQELGQKSFFRTLFITTRQAFHLNLLDAVLTRRLSIDRVENCRRDLCAVCLQTRLCFYQLKFARHSPTTSSLCKACRSRIMPVQTYVDFIHFLLSGNLKLSPRESYKRFLRLRLGINIARNLCPIGASRCDSLQFPSIDDEGDDDVIAEQDSFSTASANDSFYFVTE